MVEHADRQAAAADMRISYSRLEVAKAEFEASWKQLKAWAGMEEAN
jgi:hypothetical protein